MFPYASVPFVIAWTMLIFLSQSFETVSFIILIVSLVATKEYYNAPIKNGAYSKASYIASNVALLPLVFVNIALTPTVFLGDKIGGAGMGYLLPMIYSPIIYVVVFIFSYLYLWRKM